MRAALQATSSLAAIASVVAGLAFLLEPLLPRLQGLTSLAPIALLAALLSLALSAVVRAPKAILAIGLIGAVASSWPMSPDLIAAAQPNSRPAPEDPQLTLLSVNLWSANENPQAFEALVQREQPDIVVLQESWRWKPALARLGPEYRIHTGCNHPIVCGDVAILSKFELLEVMRLGRSDVVAVRLQLPERLGGGVIEVLGLHRSRSSDEDSEAMLSEVSAVSRTFGNNALIAGDFNTTPWSHTLRNIDGALPQQRCTRALFSWPTAARTFTRLRLRLTAPLFPIDHIYAGHGWRPVDVRRGPNIGSDHYPILATFVRSET